MHNNSKPVKKNDTGKDDGQSGLRDGDGGGGGGGYSYIQKNLKKLMGISILAAATLGNRNKKSIMIFCGKLDWEVLSGAY